MPSRQANPSAEDALSLLSADHARVMELFDHFKEIRDDVDEHEKDGLVARICGELIVHTAIEEEIFYPETRAVLAADHLFDEATVEHASAKDLIAQLGEMEPGDELFDAKVTVLGEYVRHHAREEEEEMFPKVRESSLDLVELGERLAQRKAELMDEIGLADLDAPLPWESDPGHRRSARPS